MLPLVCPRSPGPKCLAAKKRPPSDSRSVFRNNVSSLARQWKIEAPRLPGAGQKGTRHHTSSTGTGVRGKHTDKKYVGELAKRTTGEGMKNVLILIDAGNELDAKDPKQRA